jgi:hypothetical protein
VFSEHAEQEEVGGLAAGDLTGLAIGLAIKFI